ncbi:nitroreductase family protein [Corynebacterium sp. AOP40-9SA-29]|uniref:nitroreductase family protein n=1 Tax=Corynebacterium sp. AOP40-9SA-29 TaxID=3457677 RepID=UPI004034E8D6
MINKDSLPPAVRSRLVYARDLARTVADSASDTVRFIRYGKCSNGVALDSGDPGVIGYQVLKDTHRVEKALALPAPKQPFGSDLVPRLAKGVGRLSDAPTWARRDAASGQDALTSWNAGGALADDVTHVPETSGVSGDLLELLRSRSSVRNFDPQRPVDESIVHEAVAAAGGAPSVCNRQPWRVQFFSTREDIDRVLRHQNGNRGFGHTVPLLAVVAVDLRAFGGAGERNQAWVDGGIFLDELMLAFHCLGVSSCALNLSIRSGESRALREEIGADEGLEFISMAAFGYPAEGARHTRSTNRPVEELRTIR